MFPADRRWSCWSDTGRRRPPGRCSPAGRRASTSPTRARPRPKRSASASRPWWPTGRRAPVAVYASPLERTTETARPIARALGLRVRTERGLLECDFGQWTGAKLSALAKKPEWTQVQRCPSGFRFPGGRVVPRDAGPDGLGHRPTHPPAPGRDHRGRVPRRPDQGRRVEPRRAPPSTCSSAWWCHRARCRPWPSARAGPHVLTVNSTASLTELAIA